MHSCSSKVSTMGTSNMRHFSDRVPRGGGTRSESDGYVRPEMGGRKNAPYSDSKMIKKDTLTMKILGILQQPGGGKLS